MKKNSLFIATLLVVVAATVAIVSCKKEKQGQISSNSEQIVQDVGNMDEYLMAFKKKLLSAQKGEETISLEQAQRDLGNLLNFDFGDANYATDKGRYDTLYVPLLLVGSDVDMAQLANTYNMASASIIDTYNQVELSDKSILFVACSINQDAKKGDVADVQLVLATRGLSQYGPQPSFDLTDNWRVWEKLGKCDGTCVGDDHTTMLEKVYNSNRPLFECNNGRLYYTDIDSTRHFYASEFRETDPSTYYNYGFRLWCGYGDEVNNHCVEYPEIQ